MSLPPCRMAVGLGMTPDEWAELRSKVDDSFWVMRIIGTSTFIPIDSFRCHMLMAR